MAAMRMRCFTAELPERMTLQPIASEEVVMQLVEPRLASAHASARSQRRHFGSSARAAHPGCSIGRPRQAGLLARGSVLAHHLPGLAVQWSLMRGAPLTVAGAARVLTRVPVLIP